MDRTPPRRIQRRQFLRAAANPISPYNAALAKKMPSADDINHHSPGGPAGIHSGPPVNGIGIWKFSKNADLAKEISKFHFRKENFGGSSWFSSSSAWPSAPSSPRSRSGSRAGCSASNPVTEEAL